MCDDQTAVRLRYVLAATKLYGTKWWSRVEEDWNKGLLFNVINESESFKYQHPSVVNVLKD